MTERSTEHSMFEQTAFETAGIPTPYDQQDIGSTDGVSDAIQSIMDHIEEEIYHEPEPDREAGDGAASADATDITDPTD